MAIEKTCVAIFNTVTLVSGSADQTSEIDTSSYLDMVLHIRMSNGATGPTVPARVAPYIGFDMDDDGDVDIWAAWGGNLSGRIANSGAVAYNVVLPRAARMVRLYAGGNTVQNCTLEAWITATTSF